MNPFLWEKNKNKTVANSQFLKSAF